MLNITYKDRNTSNWLRDQTNFVDIMEIIKNRTWTSAGHINQRTDSISSVALIVWKPWVANKIEGFNEKGGQMKYNRTGAM